MPAQYTTHPAECFRPSRDGGNAIDARLSGKWVTARGVWPLIDENGEPTQFVAVGNKNGIPDDLLAALKAEHGSSLRFIYPCQYGPHIIDHYDDIAARFDGIFDLDCRPDHPKRLACIHSMFVRSMPYRGFFWERPEDVEHRFDFTILTWGPTDPMCKRWDRAEPVCEYLCARGLRGLVITQRGEPAELITDPLRPHVESGALVIDAAKYDEVSYHRRASEARFSIFPNTIDASPRP